MPAITPALKAIIQEKEQELSQSSLEERKTISQILNNFVMENDIIVYGGIALNTILPLKLKFYKQSSFPDYDCMSPIAKKHAIALANVFYKAGFEFTEVREAVHEGTYKIFVNFRSVADITQVRQKFFDTMMQLSKFQNKKQKHTINIAPLYLLKHYIIKELARPEGSLYRWSKVYARSKLLDTLVKFKPQKDLSTLTPPLSSQYSPETMILINRTLSFIKSAKLPIVGNLGLGMLLKGTKDPFSCCRIDEFFSIYEILSSDPMETFNQLKETLKPYLPANYKFLTSKRFFYKDVLPKRLRVYLKVKGSQKTIKFMTIIHTEHECYSYVMKNGYSVGSPYTILQYLYAYWLVYYVYEPEHIQEKVEAMIATLENYIHTQSPPKERFSTRCFGHQKTMKTINKERWNQKRAFVYRPNIKRRSE